jgi:hypothetical protein
MKVMLRGTAAAVLAGFALAGCQGIGIGQPAKPDTLVAMKVATPPNLQAFANDPAWAKAPPMTVQLTGGENLVNGETTGTLKAVYTADTLYLLVQYQDPTNSVRRSPFQKQADGSWKQLSDPKDKGGDNNLVYEDKWAMMWPIDEASVKAFEQQGCAVLCHEGEGKPYGNKYTRKDGELADMWHMKGMRTAPAGFVDDQYVDHTRYDKDKAPNAGRKSDPGKAANAGSAYFIRRGDEVPFLDSFQPGDELAGHINNVITGDRADIRVANKWENGVVTTVVARKLRTGSKYDVQFDPARRYPFGFAVFDNAQVRHATTDDASYLVFAK